MMSAAEIREQLKSLSREERLSLAEYLDVLNRLDDPATAAEINSAMQRMDSGRKISEEQLLAAHQELLAKGR